MPDQFADFVSKVDDMMSVAQQKARVSEPRDLSRFLTEHNANPEFLYCHLTRKQIKNDYKHAQLHMDGKLFRHKFYEWLRKKMSKRRGDLVSSIKVTRSLIENKRIQKLKPGDTSSNNVLDRGFLKRRKLKLISRYSKLVVLSFRPIARRTY